MSRFSQAAGVLLLVAVAGTWAKIRGWDANCITEPVGFAKGTIGGEGGEVVVPKNIKELKNYLKDHVPRIVLLNQTFDFTNTEGTSTSDGCYFIECGEGFQYSLEVSDTCNGRKKTKVTYDTAGLKPLNVGSFKTIMGVDGRGGLKGKGLKIAAAENVIIRDITIGDINPHVIWGGDALAFNQVNKVWIHNVTFKRVGRQFLVTYQKANTGVTVSSCTFDGETTNSAYCDGKAYWIWLFWGTDDRITMINNRIVNTSGRLPHAGGYQGSNNFIHIVGNMFDTNTNTGIEPYVGASLLVEGNSFHKMSKLVNDKALHGALFLANNLADEAACVEAFGEPCLLNHYSATRPVTRCDDSVLVDAVTRSTDAINDARAGAAMCAATWILPGDAKDSSSSSEEN